MTYVHCDQISRRDEIRGRVRTTVLGLETGWIRPTIVHFYASLTTVVNIKLREGYLDLFANRSLDSKQQELFYQLTNRSCYLGNKNSPPFTVHILRVDIWIGRWYNILFTSFGGYNRRVATLSNSWIIRNSLVQVYKELNNWGLFKRLEISFHEHTLEGGQTDRINVLYIMITGALTPRGQSNWTYWIKITFALNSSL